jgi:hypothetical protein
MIDRKQHCMYPEERLGTLINSHSSQWDNVDELFQHIRNVMTVGTGRAGGRHDDHSSLLSPRNQINRYFLSCLGCLVSCVMGLVWLCLVLSCLLLSCFVLSCLLSCLVMACLPLSGCVWPHCVSSCLGCFSLVLSSLLSS